MAAPVQRDTNQLLSRACAGDAGATSELLPLVYDELRALAADYLRRERPDHTLQPTALVHEAFLRLIDGARCDWLDRTHFFRTAARIMRRVLVDHARARQTAKRGAERQRITLDEAVATTVDREVDLLALDEELTKLAALNERHSRVVELRFFGGLTIDEVARTLEVSTTTIENDWSVARAWLRRELSKGGTGGDT